ncbi:MAG TPA: hypothetical protein VG710_14600 [Opitutus sp.]|nr:hypothetical protein [Opitutus sp.]
MKALRIDVIAAMAAVLAAAGAWSWCARLAGNDAQAMAVAPLRFAEASYAPAGRDVPETQAELWPAPTSPADGWLYDMFTPPEIYYDARTKAFSIAAPEIAPAPVRTAPFGLELLAVSQPLFRLQLVGFVGGEGNYRGLFENMATTETFLATEGRRLPALGLVIESFGVRDTEVALRESMSTTRRVATARVRDERTGESFSLTDGGRSYAAAAVAMLAVSGGRSTPREAREGESFELGESRYTIEKIHLVPPAVDITKESSGQLQLERRTLTPRAAADAHEPPAS